MPLDLFLEKRTLVELLLWVRRLPKDHGKKHGRNRYEKTGVLLDKHAEIARADENDRAIREEIERRTNLDLRAKRMELAVSLTPRLTDQAVEGHHARISSIVEAGERSSVGGALTLSRSCGSIGEGQRRRTTVALTR
jgi:hypothetical protein